MKVHSTIDGGPATLDMLNCFVNDRAAVPRLDRHTYLVNDLGIPRHVPALVS